MFLLALLLALTPPQALDQLKAGNQRFVQNQPIDPNRSPERRQQVSQGQTPFATVVGCSDSRVAPELIFDQGLGDLFIVRVAGNVVGPLEIDSIEYAADVVRTPLVVVLGHERCGAVTAVLAGQTKDIEALAKQIEPAVQETKGLKKDRLEQTIKANVGLVVEKLRKNKILEKWIREKKLEVLGGYYHLGSGEVEWLR